MVDPAHVPDVGDEGLKSEVDASAAYLKESPPLPADHPLRSAPGAPVMLPAEQEEILLPGEAEQHRMATRCPCPSPPLTACMRRPPRSLLGVLYPSLAS